MWMCHSRALNNKINRIQERALRIVYNDYEPNFKRSLERDHSYTIHERNMKYLATEDFKVKNGLSPVIMNDVFQFGKNSAHEFRSGIIFKEQISKLYILAANLLTRNKNMGPYSSEDKSIKISYLQSHYLLNVYDICQNRIFI